MSLCVARFKSIIVAILSSTYFGYKHLSISTSEIQTVAPTRALPQRLSTWDMSRQAYTSVEGIPLKLPATNQFVGYRMQRRRAENFACRIDQTLYSLSYGTLVNDYFLTRLPALQWEASLFGIVY